MYGKPIQRRPADTVFSKFIRLRDGECVFKAKCPTYFGKLHWDISELQCCHFHSRRKESVRFDPQNCDAGCGKCHHFIDETAEGKKWFRNFKLQQLGQRDYDLLQIRAETMGKRDDYMALMYAKGLLEGLEATTPLSELGYVPLT